jgi:hypothetical protein
MAKTSMESQGPPWAVEPVMMMMLVWDIAANNLIKMMQGHSGRVGA